MAIESTGKKNSAEASNMLAPGFRFHPTDEELVRYYLRRKVCGKGFQLDAISEIDIYKTEPWDLPSMSKLKTRDLEWYFFSVLDKKYGNGSRTNRATEKGYWKTTGKDRAVYHRTQIVGMKKTLVYHNGRAPKGLRSNWVMHEYRLADLELEKSGIFQDAFVLCRVFQKSGSGPKNGEQYGAPFVEEEWDEEIFNMVPQKQGAEEVDFGNDAYLDGQELEQILGSVVPPPTAAPPLTLQSAEGVYSNKTTESAREIFEPEQQHDENNFYNLPALFDTDSQLVKHEYIGESSKSGNSDDFNFILDEPFMDSLDDIQFDDFGFIETNDLSNPVESDSSAVNMFDDCFAFFDANGDDSQFFANDPSMMMGSEELISDQKFLLQKGLNEGNVQGTMPSGEPFDNNSLDAMPPSNKQELAKYGSDFKYPFMNQASQMLGGVHAPDAFAAEFPSKDATAAIHASTSAHMTAGIIQIGNLTVGNRGTNQKQGNLNIVLSFGYSRGEDGSANLESSVRLHPGKAASTTWMYLIFLAVVIFSMSFKMGSYICAN